MRLPFNLSGGLWLRERLLRSTQGCRGAGILKQLAHLYRYPCHGVVVAGALGLVACEWRSKAPSEQTPARVEQVASRAFDDLALEGSEVFLSMLPINVAEPTRAQQEPQICIYEVNFLRQVIESSEAGTLKLLENSYRPINAYSFNASDVMKIMNPPGKDARARRQKLGGSREASLAQASQALRKIFMSLGLPDSALDCDVFRGIVSPEPSGPGNGFTAVLERIKARLSERRRRENAAIFGPESPLFARTLDETAVEPLHSGEYTLILGRMKQLALKHDLEAATSGIRDGQDNSSSGRVFCANRFELRDHLPALQEIVGAFPSARPIPGRPELP